MREWSVPIYTERNNVFLTFSNVLLWYKSCVGFLKIKIYMFPAMISRIIGMFRKLVRYNKED